MSWEGLSDRGSTNGPQTQPREPAMFEAHHDEPQHEAEASSPAAGGPPPAGDEAPPPPPADAAEAAAPADGDAGQAVPATELSIQEAQLPRGSSAAQEAHQQDGTGTADASDEAAPAAHVNFAPLPADQQPALQPADEAVGASASDAAAPGEPPVAAPPQSPASQPTAQAGGTAQARFLRRRSKSQGRATKAAAAAGARGNGGGTQSEEEGGLHSEDILRELEVQRQRHHQQVGAVGRKFLPLGCMCRGAA